MISKIHNSLVSLITNTFENYGVKLQAQYNSDIDMIKQYINSLNLRYMYKDSTLPGLTDDDLIKLNKKSYNLLLYKFGPFKKSERGQNFKNLALLFDPNTTGTDFVKNNVTDPDFYQFISFIREVNQQDFVVRDGFFGQAEYEFTIMSSNTELMNHIQFIYLSQLSNINKLSLTLETPIEPLELEYFLEFDEISEFGHIDYERYGNLQHLSFSCRLEGLVLSNYKYIEPKLNKIDIGLDVINKNETDAKFVQDGIEKFHNDNEETI